MDVPESVKEICSKDLTQLQAFWKMKYKKMPEANFYSLIIFKKEIALKKIFLKNRFISLMSIFKYVLYKYN